MALARGAHQICPPDILAPSALDTATLLSRLQQDKVCVSLYPRYQLQLQLQLQCSSEKTAAVSPAWSHLHPSCSMSLSTINSSEASVSSMQVR